MKKIILIMLTMLNLYANTTNTNNTLNNEEKFNYPYKDFYMVIDYVKNHGGKIDFDLASKLNTDFHWLKGNEFLTSKRYIKDLTSKVISKHNSKIDGTNLALERYRAARRALTPYTSSKTKEALKEFYESATENKNPLAAFEGMTLLVDYHNKDSDLNKKYRKRFAKILIKNNICWGYIIFGDMYRDGSFDTKKDKKIAFNIYKDGLPVCKKNVFKSWQFKQLNSRYFKLKRFYK